LALSVPLSPSMLLLLVVEVAPLAAATCAPLPLVLQQMELRRVISSPL
jgi:hypothetical protein